MIRLNLLGGACVLVEGRLLSGRAAQRHRVALLALLANAPHSTVSRDKLIGRLWPEHDTQRARHLLNVGLHILRGALGAQFIVSSGDDIRLDATVVSSDVIDFGECIRKKDFEGAVALYAGPFLDGFFLKGAIEFEQWAEAERNRLARLYHNALQQLAERAESNGDLTRAAVWWRAAAVSEPYNALIATRLIRVLHATGDREGAFDHARAHHGRVAEDLGVEADPAISSLVAELRRVPRPALQLGGRERPALSQAEIGVAPAPIAHLAAGRTRRWLKAAGLLVLPVMAGLAWLLTGLKQTPAPEAERLLILPFAFRGPPELAHLGEGLVELLSAQLEAEDIDPVDPAAVFIALRDSKDSIPNGAESRSLAKRFGARHYVTGSVVDLGSNLLQLQAALYDLDVDAPIARATGARSRRCSGHGDR